MTYKLKASQLAAAGLTAETYGDLVRYHASELAGWTAHMGRVEASLHLPPDIPDPSQPPPEEGKEREHVQRFVCNPDKHMPYPPPAAPPLVGDAVNRDGFVADYEIDDDLPSADERLAARKGELLGQVAKAEDAALARVLPAGKRRLAQMRYNASMAKACIVVADGPDATKIVDARSDWERAECEAHEATLARLDAIALQAAQASSDVEDLTAETIDAWQMPAFPE